MNAAAARHERRPGSQRLDVAARIDGTCREVVDRAVRRHEIVLSEPVVREPEAVAARRSQAPYREAMEAVVGEIVRLGVFVEPATVAFGLRDPDDQVYLATAETGEAILVTGNTRDFVETRYGELEVWSPRTFVDRTNSDQGAALRRRQ